MLDWVRRAGCWQLPASRAASTYPLTFDPPWTPARILRLLKDAAAPRAGYAEAWLRVGDVSRPAGGGLKKRAASSLQVRATAKAPTGAE